MSAAVRSAALLGVCAMVSIACGGNRHGSSSAGLSVFNACIARNHFLDLVRDRHATGFVEVINDRAEGAKVGEVTSGRAASILGGAAASNGQFTMSTATPLGRDATAIERCWDQLSPIAPTSWPSRVPVHCYRRRRDGASAAAEVGC